MQENIDEAIEVSNDFNELEFGIKNKGVPYRGAASVSSIIAKSPSIPASICGVLKKCCVEFSDIKLFSSVQNFIVGYDEFDQKIYLRAEVGFENLHMGFDLTDKSLLGFVVNSVKGDVPYKFIPNNIGGPDCALNAFPLNPSAEIKPFETALSLVYKHIQAGPDNIARLIYIMDYGYENVDFYKERPFKIYYNFKFYKNNELIGEDIEGQIINPLPPPIMYVPKTNE